jgi:hypothetical protein
VKHHSKKEYRKAESRALFCQQNELISQSGRGLIWKETARSLKFVELVEDNGRWSKPHVSTYSFFDYIELRRAIAEGYVKLDLNSTSLAEIAGNYSSA